MQTPGSGSNLSTSQCHTAMRHSKANDMRCIVCMNEICPQKEQSYGQLLKFFEKEI